VADFAVAPDHSIYATYVPPPGPGPKTLRLARLTPDGKVLWTAATTVEIFNAQLRIGPDDALYVVGGHDGTHDWTRLTKKEFLYELQVLRPARSGGTSVRFALAPAGRVVFGDTPTTGVRVGPDGQLYQLRTSRTGGVDIARYVLDPVQHPTPPTTAPAPKPPTPTGPPIDNGGMTAPPATVAVAQPAAPAASRSATGAWLPWVAGVAASALAGLAVWLVYRRRHPAGPGPNGGSGVSS
jgi:hypothetical protein